MTGRVVAHAAGPGDAPALLAGVLSGHPGAAVSAYLPMRSEIDPLPGISGHDGPLAMPVIEQAGRPLRFRAWHPGAALLPGPFGASVPAEGGWVVPRILIVPLLAFDRRGFRLGYGGGFYDRTLAALRATGPVLAVGYAYAAQEVPEVPVDAFDQRLDLIVTDRAVLIPAD